MIKKFGKTTIVTIILLMSMVITSYAMENHTHETADNELMIFDGSIAPIYEITCPSGKHNMKSNGIGIAKNSSGQTFFRGYCYQCSNCYLVLCSERDPVPSRTLGKYCFYMAYEPIGTVGCIVDNANIQTFNGDLRTDSFWQGFVFSKGL